LLCIEFRYICNSFFFSFISCISLVNTPVCFSFNFTKSADRKSKEIVKLNEKQTGVLTREIQEINEKKKELQIYLNSIHNNKDVLNKNSDTNKTLCIHRSTKLNAFVKKSLKLKKNLKDYEEITDKLISRSE
jgi:hypothetical protein